MEKEVLEIHSIKDTTANPAPLGLLAFGMTTVLLNIHNAGFFGLSSMIVAMGIFYGGIAQVIVGIMEWKKGNTFGTLAFTSYGLFWLTLCALWLLPGTDMVQALTWAGPSKGAMAWYLFMWGIFTAAMFFGTLKSNRALQFVFASLALLFFLLALGDVIQMATLNDAGGPNMIVTKIAGWEGIICGAAAIYTGLALVLNEVHGREVLPLWHVK